MGIQRFVRVEMTPDLEGPRPDREISELEGLTLVIGPGEFGCLYIHYEDEQGMQVPYHDQCIAHGEWVAYRWDARQHLEAVS